MTPQMYFLLIALLILSAAATFIIVKRIEHQCKHEWEDLLGYVEKHAPFAMELIKQLGKDYKLQ